MSDRTRPTAPSSWTDGTTESSSHDSPASNGSGQLRRPRTPPQQPPVSRPPTSRAPFPTNSSPTVAPTGSPAGSPTGSPGSPGSPGLPGSPGSPGGESRVTAAKQAVRDRASAMREATTQVTPTRQRETSRQPAAASTTRSAAAPRTRKARLRLARIDPWSVMKTAFLLSIAFGIVTWVAVFVVWSAIGAAGVFENINRTVSEVLGTPAAEPFRIEDYVGTNKVMGFTTLIACADVLILTALATLGAFLYNLAASLLGGLEVTLASED
jgi:hypothetical protein